MANNVIEFKLAPGDIALIRGYVRESSKSYGELLERLRALYSLWKQSEYEYSGELFNQFDKEFRRLCSELFDEQEHPPCEWLSESESD